MRFLGACLGLLALAGLPLLAAAAAGTPAACITMDYFPTASLITGNSTGVVTNGNLTCTGSQDCGFPAPWTRTAQEAAAAALSADLANGLLSVAIGATHPTASPVIYFTPVSPLLTAGEDAGACVGPTLPTRRRLLAADAYNVTTPGTWSFTVAVDGGAPLSGASLTAGGAGVIAPLTLAGAPGNHCVEVTVTISGYTLAPVPTASNVSDSFAQTFCWWNLPGSANMELVEFDMCSNTSESLSVAVNASTITPLRAAVPVKQGTEDVGNRAALLQPLLTIWGRLNKTVDGENVTDQAFDADMNPIPWITKYIDVGALASPDGTLKEPLAANGSLAEGQYRLSVKVSLVSRFPELIDLEGAAAISQDDVDWVAGYTEFMGDTAVDAQLFGVQRYRTNLSEIASDKTGQAVTEGANITFMFAFQGIADDVTCYHDADRITDCESPVIVAAKPFTADANFHTFSVMFSDVCGGVKMANYSYTAAGVTKLTAPDPYVTPSTPSAPSPSPSPKPKNAAAPAAAASFLSSLALGLAGCLVMAASL